MIHVIRLCSVESDPCVNSDIFSHTSNMAWEMIMFVCLSVQYFGPVWNIFQLQYGFQWRSWCPDIKSYWCLWSPDFPISASMRLNICGSGWNIKTFIGVCLHIHQTSVELVLDTDKSVKSEKIQTGISQQLLIGFPWHLVLTLKFPSFNDFGDPVTFQLVLPAGLTSFTSRWLGTTFCTDMHSANEID